MQPAAMQPADPVPSRATLPGDAGATAAPSFTQVTASPRDAIHPARGARDVQPSELAAPAPTARGQGLLVLAPVRVKTPVATIVATPVAPSVAMGVAPGHAGVPAALGSPGVMAAPAAVAAPAPTIQVTIGRIEVRATAPSTPERKRRPAPAAMSLDEYLDRNGSNYRGGRR
jgi:hypothetical protein